MRYNKCFLKYYKINTINKEVIGWCMGIQPNLKFATKKHINKDLNKWIKNRKSLKKYLQHIDPEYLKVNLAYRKVYGSRQDYGNFTNAYGFEIKKEYPTEVKELLYDFF